MSSPLTPSPGVDEGLRHLVQSAPRSTDFGPYVSSDVSFGVDVFLSAVPKLAWGFPPA